MLGGECLRLLPQQDARSHQVTVSGIKNMENYMYTWNVGEPEANKKRYKKGNVHE